MRHILPKEGEVWKYKDSTKKNNLYKIINVTDRKVDLEVVEVDEYKKGYLIPNYNIIYFDSNWEKQENLVDSLNYYYY